MEKPMEKDDTMNDSYEIDDCIKEAIRTVDDFIFKTTGKRASQQEIATALTRFFVLKELLDFIKMEREDG